MQPRLLPPAVIKVSLADSPSLLERASLLLYAHLPFNERTIRIADSLVPKLVKERDEIVLLAEDSGTPAGALLVKLRPGRTAFIWPPVVVASEIAAQIADALLIDANRRLDIAGVVLGQALLEQNDFVGHESFARNEFPHLTNLALLARSFDEQLPARSGLTWASHSFTPTDRVRFAHLIERTFVGSLDCAELRGALSGDESLALHQASGKFDPRFWLRFEVHAHDAGLVLVNPYPELNSCEVAYVGVVPESRGEGLGREMLIEALLLARNSGFSEAFLAVDEKNHFARATYHQLGFRLRESRAVHLRTHSGHPVS
ncbi:MAG: GNAT family N-acetyltransferase [Planctomycetales bacterium]|nr:GNAT family N-acetyltransferase [Planctomycetales bacterium]